MKHRPCTTPIHPASSAPLAPLALIALLALLAWAGLTPSRAIAQDPAATDTPPPGVELPVLADTLENGMRVLALRRPGAPTASFVLRFDVGSVDEALGETGIAHFLEHLLFKGTSTIGTTDLALERSLFPAMDAVHDSLLAVRAAAERGGAGGTEGAPADTAAMERLRRRLEALGERTGEVVVPNQFDRILTENGARDMNATTGHEATTYYVRLPSNRAELFFVLEADRLANPVFREFYAERDVVAEERRMRVDNTGAGRLAEQFHATAFDVHPYGVPVIGHMSDIRTYTRGEVAAFHRRHYRPGNAVLAVVGDVDPRQIVRWARRYFGPIPAGEPPPPRLVEEPEQRGERRVEVVFDAEPEVSIGWRVPDGYHPDTPALSVLAQLLGGGKTGRLYRRLVVEDRLASYVSVGIGPGFRGPRLFTVHAQPLGEHTTAELEAAIYEEIDRLQREPPTDLEMQRVRNQAEAAEVHRLASNLGLAFQLVESAAYHGDWRETFRSGERLAAVEAEEVRRVAREYLQPERRTVATLVQEAP